MIGVADCRVQTELSSQAHDCQEQNILDPLVKHQSPLNKAPLDKAPSKLPHVFTPHICWKAIAFQHSTYFFEIHDPIGEHRSNDDRIH